MEKPSKYKILLSKDALVDIKETKKYILTTVIEGLEIYFKPYSTYLIFFVVEEDTVTVIRVLKDRMYWQPIMKRMRKINR